MQRFPNSERLFWLFSPLPITVHWAADSSAKPWDPFNLNAPNLHMPRPT